MLKNIRLDKNYILGGNKGFTLIELLIVILVIGILAVLVLANVRTIRAKARDVRRVSDINSIQQALAMYHNDNQAYPYPYPPPGQKIDGTDAFSTALIDGGVLQNVPADPLDTIPYEYWYVSADGRDYLLQYCLETDSVPDRSQGVNTASP